MPGPFLGMDPYLEHATHWRGLHELLISSLTGQLNAVLPEGFAANIDERLYVVASGRSIYPDVALIERPVQHVGGSSTATLAAPIASDPPVVVTVLSEPVRESFVEIRTADEASELVAIIEVLSPTNKTPGNEGRDEYVAKQRQLLASPAHLLEIDLLRSGEHTVAIPERDLPGRVGPYDYLICLHRAGRGVEYEVWPNRLRDRLPRVHIPLVDGLPDVTLDLQAAFDRAYENGPYRRRVDYRTEPTPPLRPEDAAWADALLREKSVR